MADTPYDPPHPRFGEAAEELGLAGAGGGEGAVGPAGVDDLAANRSEHPSREGRADRASTAMGVGSYGSD